METLNICTQFLAQTMNLHSRIVLTEEMKLFFDKFSKLVKVTGSTVKIRVKPLGKKCLHCGKYIPQNLMHKSIGLWCNPIEHLMCSSDCLKRHSLIYTNFTLLDLNYVTCPKCWSSIHVEQINEAFEYKIEQYQSDACDRALLSLLNEEGKMQLESKFDCDICMNTFRVSEGLTLECDHRFCGECMKAYTVGQIESAQVSDKNLICPKCKHPMTLYEIEDIVGPELFEKYQRFLLKGFRISDQEDPNSAIFNCPSPDCDFFCIYDKNLKSIECQKCFYQYCTSCGNPPHENMTCEEYKVSINSGEADLKFKEMLRAEGIINCPSCGAAVQRISGCEFMVCTSSACQGRTYFCYDCGIKLLHDHEPHNCDRRLVNNRPHIPVHYMPAHRGAGRPRGLRNPMPKIRNFLRRKGNR